MDLNNKTRFVHPKELGMPEYPINTKEQLCALSKIISASYNSHHQQPQKSQYVPQERKSSYDVVK